MVTTPTLSAVEAILSPVFPVNSAAENEDFYQGVTTWMVSPGAPPPF